MYHLTAIPGSSRWFERGFVTYTNDAKLESLGVEPSLIERFGAVSEPVVEAMALGAISNSRGDIGLATSGIAGPDGGTEQKPVGTVCMAVVDKNGKSLSITHCFSGDRQQVRESSIQCLLSLLLNFLLNSSE